MPVALVVTVAPVVAVAAQPPWPRGRVAAWPRGRVGV